jgi:phage shock protein PspC (stress-responsive transcriptional regulator)
MSGIVASLARPGHDGKLFVSALLPLMLIALVLGVRQRRLVGHVLLAVTIALALLSPQFQMTYYSLIIAAIFAVYLAFGDPETLRQRDRITGLSFAFGAVLLGFGIAMIQILPFFHYIPFSPRATEITGGFEAATSYAIPWDHIPEFFLAGFTGAGFDAYWGPNPLKFHSEYLGLPVVALAVFGIGAPYRRRLVRWLLVVAVLFMLISLGADTPFYRVWWAVMPYAKKTRAPGMAFFAVAFVTSFLAAFAVERLEKREGGRWPTVSLIIAGVVALLAVAGVFGSVAESLAVAGGKLQIAQADRSMIMWGALGSALALALVAGVVAAYSANRITVRTFAFTLVLLVGADLWLNARGFWLWSRPEQEIYRADAFVQMIQRAPLPYRVFEIPRRELYPGTVLMKHNIPQALGYHGNELRYYDDLLGGKGEWRYLLSNIRLWDLLAIRFFIYPDTTRLPGYHRVAGPTVNAAGNSGYLYEADTVPHYARVVPGAIKADSAAIVPTIQDPRFDPNRIVLFGNDASVTPAALTALPPPSPSRATVTHWQPGRMSIALAPVPPAASYVLVSENWYTDWRATVDGSPVTVLRGDNSLITVPVAAGAKSVELWIDSREYRRGRLITWLSCTILALVALVPVVQRRMRRA